MQIVLMLLAVAVAAEPPTYQCGFTNVEPKLDGIIDDQWQQAAWTSEFVEVDTGAAAKLKTRAKIMWDERHLYIAAEMEDPDVAATKTKRDAHLWEENAFEIFIDPDDDGENYAELQINPLNTLLDLTISRPYRVKGRANFGWNIEGLRSAVHVDGTVNDGSDRDRGWTMEMAVPLAALEKLGPAPKAGVRWRMLLTRVLGRENDPARQHWAWTPTGEINFHMPEKWGYLAFSRE